MNRWTRARTGPNRAATASVEVATAALEFEVIGLNASPSSVR
jgi:hypothetical protein